MRRSGGTFYTVSGIEGQMVVAVLGGSVVERTHV